MGTARVVEASVVVPAVGGVGIGGVARPELTVVADDAIAKGIAFEDDEEGIAGDLHEELDGGRGGGCNVVNGYDNE